jgi:hypothetical protein
MRAACVAFLPWRAAALCMESSSEATRSRGDGNSTRCARRRRSATLGASMQARRHVQSGSERVQRARCAAATSSRTRSKECPNASAIALRRIGDGTILVPASAGDEIWSHSRHTSDARSAGEPARAHSSSSLSATSTPAASPPAEQFSARCNLRATNENGIPSPSHHVISCRMEAFATGNDSVSAKVSVVPIAGEGCRPIRESPSSSMPRAPPRSRKRLLGPQLVAEIMFSQAGRAEVRYWRNDISRCSTAGSPRPATAHASSERAHNLKSKPKARGRADA